MRTFVALISAAAVALAAPSVPYQDYGYYGPSYGKSYAGVGVGVGAPGFGGPGFGIGGPGYYGGFGSFAASTTNFFAEKLAEHERLLKELTAKKWHREIDIGSEVKEKVVKERDAKQERVKDNRTAVGDRGFGLI